MESPQEKLARLLDTPEWTEDERRWMLDYLELPDNDALKQLMFNDYNEKLRISDEDKMVSPSSRVLDNIHQRIGVKPSLAIRRSVNRYRWAVAASVIVVLAIGSVLFVNLRNPNRQVAAREVRQNRPAILHDVLPGSNKALLTLSDGSTIALDDAENGNLAKQGNTSILKNNGRLTYQTEQATAPEPLFNTVATPRGGQYQVTLPDGSEVWLNAESSIRFPTAFTGAERRVEITGEAYFEVAKNAARPFIVRVQQSEVKVLGTHFNVMAYNGEAHVKTTLLEGSVEFIHGDSKNLLAPGQQAQLGAGGRVLVESNVNVEEELAWKNGSFHFERAGIQTVMRQLERWYDVEVVYKSAPSDELFHADIPRNTNLSMALRALELTGKVRFQIEGKKIIVIP